MSAGKDNSAQGAAQPQSLPELLDYCAQRYGDDPAIRAEGLTLSFRELQAAAADMARGLLTAGVGKGSRVALLAGNTPFWIVSFFASAQVGALTIPISTLASPGELAHILRHSDAHLLLAERTYVGRDYGQLIERALPSLSQAVGGGPLRLHEVPYLRSIWLDDPAGLEWAGDTGALIAAGKSDKALDEAFLAGIKEGIHPSDDGVIIYTSGSTALPKAVVHGHGSMARHAQVLADNHFPTPGHDVLCVLPMFWVGGLSMLLETFINGGSIVLPAGVSPQSVATALQKLGADMLHGWHAQLKTVRDLMLEQGADIEGIRNLRTERLPDGTPRPPDLVPNSLGMTESFGPHCASPVGTLLPEDRRGAFGPPIGTGDRRVVNPDTGEVLEPGQVGELQLRGGALMKGYYKRERSETFTPDGYFATNDLVRIEPDGHMYFSGRLGDMLKTKGANVSRLEVESALRGLDGVREVVVCGLPDPELGDRVVAAVAPAADATLDEAAMKAALSERLPAYKIPTDIVVIDHDDFLWTPSGKIRIADMAQLIAGRIGHSA
ncbi:class I adenylate-forming enzyme family protein [Novosphingobium pentaromativorans]|uniref:AMP-dependent synthetase and ligase n=1 Tax=Novosphingobium pentaromativorans US6-1 TaxID=1088721 RepID=G6ED52_9SPHN|nr:class I adenylate-forming enzyme family protein [Novosphingobium pentaromativorans]EHJ60764.1 hypothetical protein NSU_2273 [Novosphingobium pentaromativorans US6-1]